MHDPALWTSWYVWFLVIPTIVIGTMISDWIQQRRLFRARRAAGIRRRSSTPARRAHF